MTSNFDDCSPAQKRHSINSSDFLQEDFFCCSDWQWFGKEIPEFGWTTLRSVLSEFLNEFYFWWPTASLLSYHLMSSFPSAYWVPQQMIYLDLYPCLGICFWGLQAKTIVILLFSDRSEAFRLNSFYILGQVRFLGRVNLYIFWMRKKKPVRWSIILLSNKMELLFM